MFNDDSYASLHLNDILDSYFLENESQFSKINFLFFFLYRLSNLDFLRDDLKLLDLDIEINLG